MWGFLAGTPWPVLILLSFVALGVAMWICERTLSRTKPGDDARIRFLGVIRIHLRRAPSSPAPPRRHKHHR